MPGMDRSGPMGMGAGTGGGFGLCSGNDRTSGGVGPRRRFFGMGTGRGAGMRNRGRRPGRFSFVPGFSRFGRGVPPAGELDPEMEREALEREANALQSGLKVVRDRLAALDKPSA